MTETTVVPTLAKANIALVDVGWTYWKYYRKLPTEKSVADAMGISEVTLWRVRKGHARPGEAFIAKAISTFGAGFDHLFVVRDAA